MATVAQPFCDSGAGVGSRLLAPGRVHMVGIAGSGMQSLAAVLGEMGWDISGSDLNPSPLHGERLRVVGRHAASNVTAAHDLVIYSDAIERGNPELARAVQLGIPCLSYPQALGELMSNGLGVAVAGTHGKSTTTAMAAQILLAARLDPTVVVGATPLGAPSGGRCGTGRWMLAEACEYRENFLHLRPSIAVVLGIEPDHFDYFRSAEHLESAFLRFMRQIPADGWLLYHRDCPVSRRLARTVTCRCESFGLGDDADWQGIVATGDQRISIEYRGKPIGRIALQVPGRHNVLNAMAAAALAHRCGAPREAIVAGLEQFAGLHRRLEILGERGGIALVDDYAHHPTEIAASLAALRQRYPGRRLWCVYQPHQVSRTEALLDDMAQSLQNADRVVVVDIFRAREPNCRAEVTAAQLAARTRDLGADVSLQVHRIPEIEVLLNEALRPGDVLVAMGAGDIGKILHGIGKRV